MNQQEYQEQDLIEKIVIGDTYRVNFDTRSIIGRVAHAPGYGMLEIGNLLTFHPEDVCLISHDGHVLTLAPEDFRKYDVTWKSSGYTLGIHSRVRLEDLMTQV